MSLLISHIGHRGTLVIPAALRKRFGLRDGVQVLAEAREDGILIRPVSVSPLEIYSDKRKAEFLLNNAVTEADYQRALSEVQSMGLNPSEIPHELPGA